MHDSDPEIEVEALDSSSYRNTNKWKIEAWLRLLYSIFKSERETLSLLFATDSSGHPIFRRIMSLKRCETLLLVLRFDNSSNKSKRRITDPATANTNI